MLNQLTKQRENFKDHHEHMEYIPPYSLNPKNNLDEIVKLTTRSYARFKVRGDHRNFVIEGKSDNIIIGISLLLFILMPTAYLLQNPAKLIPWLIELSILALIYLIFRYMPSTYNIEINPYDKSIKINSNNLIGRYIIPKVEIPFNEFTEFTFKAKATRQNHWNRIYISYNNKKMQLIDLPNGPFTFINHKIFMDCLSRIIKTGV